MKNKIAVYLLVVLFIHLLLGCSKNTQPKTVEKIPTAKNTEASITQTSVPALTPTSSPTPSPTLSSQEKSDRVEELQENNGGCSYPCWWGVTPGITTWDEVTGILAPIMSESLEFTIENGMKMYYLEFPSDSQNIIVNIFISSDGVVDVIRFGQDYPMVDFLKNYGNPSEIWISSDGIVPGPSLFRITFLYPEKGIMAGYIGKSNLISRDGVDYIKMCAVDFNSYGPFWAWNPNLGKQFEALPIENLIGQPPTSLRFKRINEYTNFDEMTFFNYILENSDEACLETPAEIWPNPDLYIITPTP